MAINRDNDAITVTIAAAATTSGSINMQQWAGGVCRVPAGWSSNTTLTFTHATTAAGTYSALYQDDCSTQVSVTLTADRSFALPEEVLMCNFVKFVIGAGAAAEETLELSLKG